MMTPRAWYLAIGLTLGIAGLRATPQVFDRLASDASRIPKLMHTCLITNNVNQLVRFYEPILRVKAQRSGEDYVEFHTGAGVLAVFSAKAQERYMPSSTDAAGNRSAILEFEVADVDAEYIRLRSLVKTWVKPPTTQPWGTRSIYFRDPDGNLIDFYALGTARQ